MEGKKSEQATKSKKESVESTFVCQKMKTKVSARGSLPLFMPLHIHQRDGILVERRTSRSAESSPVSERDEPCFLGNEPGLHGMIHKLFHGCDESDPT